MGGRKRRGHEHKIKPVRQAREACYALRDFIENDDRWSQGRLRWDHVIVLPNAEIADDFALPECRRWEGHRPRRPRVDRFTTAQSHCQRAVWQS
jgi:hypothetical protein